MKDCEFNLPAPEGDLVMELLEREVKRLKKRDERRARRELAVAQSALTRVENAMGVTRGETPETPANG